MTRPIVLTSLVLSALLFASSAPEEGPEIDYRTPEREYERVDRPDLTVFVERQLLKEAPQVELLAVTRLERKRNEALALLPKATQDELRRIPFYLMYGSKARGGGKDNGAKYFPPAAPDEHSWVDPRWRNVIVVHSAQNYSRITDFWAGKAVLHELAHAHHLLHWPPKHPPILHAWESAMQRSLYRNVVDEKGKLHELAYAGTNQLEYFAELSCMYFLGCNYYPHSRSELETYDPDGARMVKSIWGE